MIKNILGVASQTQVCVSLEVCDSFCFFALEMLFSDIEYQEVFL
jgi:hypothetical protein